MILASYSQAFCYFSQSNSVVSFNQRVTKEKKEKTVSFDVSSLEQIDSSIFMVYRFKDVLFTFRKGVG